MLLEQLVESRIYPHARMPKTKRRLANKKLPVDIYKQTGFHVRLYRLAKYT